jgi:hypothetical protein
VFTTTDVTVSAAAGRLPYNFTAAALRHYADNAALLNIDGARYVGFTINRYGVFRKHLAE